MDFGIEDTLIILSQQLKEMFEQIIKWFSNQENLTPQYKRDLELILQTSIERQVWVKIEILDNNNNVIDEVSGSAVGGSYNIDSTSAIRRTCSITFNLEQGYLPDPNSVFWINKRFKLYIGLKNPYVDNIYWFNKGVYAIKDPSISITLTDNTITINGIDKMALHTGDISGQLDTAFIIDTKDDEGNVIYVEDAVEALMKDGGETKLAISKTDFAIPYKIETAIGDMRWGLISKLTDLFYNYQAYYDLDGFFIFDTKPMYQSSNNVVNEIEMNFSQNYENDLLATIPYNLIISINRDIDYNNVKNKIVVYGGVHDDGCQASCTLFIDDENYNNSPYTIEKLGEKNADGSLVCRTLVVQDDAYVDDGSHDWFVVEFVVKQNLYDFVEISGVNGGIYNITNLPLYMNPNIPSDNNAYGEVKEQQGVVYQVTWDDEVYDIYPRQYYGNTYYVGNVWLYEQIAESGDYTEEDATEEDGTVYPFVCWYDGKTFGIYTNQAGQHTVQVARLEATNHSYAYDLCKDRAIQEAYLHQQATDKVTITCLPIYSLDVNKVIYLDDSKSGAVGEYVITNISCGLGAGDTMSITANKLW